MNLGVTKILGIIGGIAPPSTIDYYRGVTSGYRARSEDDSYPRVLINSIDGNRFLAMVSSDEREPLVEYLVQELERLSGAGAVLGLFASNTPHVVFDEVAERSPMPLISIVEATAEVAEAHGYRKLGLLGAGITMDRDFYPRVFGRRAIAVVVPNADERRCVNERYFTELVEGQFRDETRREISEVIDRMVERDDIDGVILGGTELPLLFRGSGSPRIPTLDTTAIHVDSAIERLLSG